MELRQFRYLDRVVAAGGFRSAARDLGVSQPALTAQIKQLERDIGVELLDRSHRPIRTTPAGAVVVACVRDVLSMVTRLHADIAELTGQEKGRLKLGVNQWAAPIMPWLMSSFTHAYPNVDVVLRECVSREAPRFILRDELDACLLAVRTGHDRLPPQLRSTRLFAFENVFAVPPGHRFEGLAQVSLADVAGERLVLTSGMSGQVLRDACARLGVTPHIAVETNDADMVPSLVAQGMGIGFTPDFVVRRVHPELKTLKTPELALSGDAVLAWSNRSAEQPALLAFVRHVRSLGWGDADRFAA